MASGQQDHCWNVPGDIVLCLTPASRGDLDHTGCVAGWSQQNWERVPGKGTFQLCDFKEVAQPLCFLDFSLAGWYMYAHWGVMRGLHIKCLEQGGVDTHRNTRGLVVTLCSWEITGTNFCLSFKVYALDLAPPKRCIFLLHRKQIIVCFGFESFGGSKMTSRCVSHHLHKFFLSRRSTDLNSVCLPNPPPGFHSICFCTSRWREVEFYNFQQQHRHRTKTAALLQEQNVLPRCKCLSAEDALQGNGLVHPRVGTPLHYDLLSWGHLPWISRSHRVLGLRCLFAGWLPGYLFLDHSHYEHLFFPLPPGYHTHAKSLRKAGISWGQVRG